jgi:hypothetical protein
MTTAALLAAPMSVSVGLAGSQEWRGGGSNTGGLPGAVRQAAERFKNVDEAVAAGYQQFQGCVSGPEEGAMGVHDANFALFDVLLEVDRPEVLVYEPLRSGRLRLVAVEYITPAAAWHGSHVPRRAAGSHGPSAAFRTRSQSVRTGSWEIDVFGGLRRGREAARVEYAASEAGAVATRLAVAAHTADVYARFGACRPASPSPVNKSRHAGSCSVW